MNMRLLILEGKTDVSFFLPILKGIYGFNEYDHSIKERIPIGRHKTKSAILSTPIPLVKNDVLLIVYHTGGKDNLPKAVRNIIYTLEIWEDELKPGVIGVVRDADTNKNIMNWIKSILREFEPQLDNDSLKIGEIQIVPFALGDINVGISYVESKQELELMLVELANKESTLTKFSSSIQALSRDKGKLLTPKDIMHVLAIAKDFDGDEISGLYRGFMEKLIRNQRRSIMELLKSSGLSGFLVKITG
ncbi:DUF3226 domain-containing protein [Thermococcus sp.]